MVKFFDEKDPLLQNVGWVTLFFHLFRLSKRKKTPEGLERPLFGQFMGKLADTRAILRKITQGIDIGRARPDSVLQQFVNLGQSSNDGSAIIGRYKIIRRYFRDHLDVQLPPPGE